MPAMGGFFTVNGLADEAITGGGCEGVNVVYRYLHNMEILLRKPQTDDQTLRRLAST